MKQINNEQINIILQLLIELNCGIKQYTAVNKLLNELPEIKEEKKK